jgi:hypothetical protein
MAVNGTAVGARYGLTLELVKPLIIGNPGTTVCAKANNEQSSIPAFSLRE